MSSRSDRNLSHFSSNFVPLDTDILDWLRAQVHAAGCGNYQTLINDALREHVQGKRPTLEQTLRRVVREELARPRARLRGSR